MRLTATAAPASLEATVCIVGAGPVGLALAGALVESGVDVVLLESGMPDGSQEAEALNEGLQEGDPYAGPAATRARGPGGTAAVWNTVHHGIPMAKYLPLDIRDLEARDGDPLAGWPFGMEHLLPWYRQAQRVCGLGPAHYDGDGWGEPARPHLPLAAGGLATGVYQFGPAARFTRELPQTLCNAPGATVIHGATVTGLSWRRDGHQVEDVTWTSTMAPHISGCVRAAAVVLAAGALENARILLLVAEQDGAPAGLGGTWLGRGFMEHPIDRSLTLRTRHEALARGPGFYACRDAPSGVPVMGRIVFTAGMAAAERHEINASVRLLLDDTPAVLRAAPARALGRRLLPAAAARRAVGRVVRKATSLVAAFRPVHYRLLMDLEQRPHPENRVTLSSRRDALGQPRLTLHWRWRMEDEVRRRQVVSSMAAALEASGAGRVDRASATLNPDAHHHAGTTRMHPTPELGVVDGDLRVHGTANLWVAGASVFPTSGMANPTLTAVALALRLAHHLSFAFATQESP